MNRCFVLSALFVCLASAENPKDWPKFGGPNGDFHLPGASLTWPEGGPKKVWQRELGEGYSSVSSDGSTLYTMYRRKDEKEVVIAMEASTGKTIWEYAYDAPLPADFDVSNTTGPRATPFIHGDALYTAGVSSIIHKLDRKTGKPLWSHNLVKEFNGELRHNGYTPCPIVWGDTVIAFPWAKGAAIAAFKQSDGSLVWKKHDYVLSYSTPILAKIGSKEQILTMFSEGVMGFDPSNGDLLWSFPHSNNQSVNVALPIWRGDGLMMLSSGYGTGARGLKILEVDGKIHAEQIWTQPIVRVHHSDMVRIGDTVFAASGDMGPCPLTATDINTGKLLWRDRAFPKASLIAVGKQLLILDEDGTLALATPNETGLTVHGKMKVLENNAWTPPTVVGTRVIVRDRKNLAVYDFQR